MHDKCEIAHDSIERLDISHFELECHVRSWMTFCHSQD